MIQGFKRVHIAVPELAPAIAGYSLLLGFESRAGVFQLGNIEVELHELPGLETGKDSKIDGLTFWDPDGTLSGPIPAAGSRGLSLAVARDPRGSQEHSDIQAVDHIVLRTADADDCIRLFGETGLGLRLALDQNVPEWGGRMLFFRSGKLTLEIIHSLDDPPEHDFFWGLTYACHNLDATLARFDASGIEHSAARAGRKPGTRVSTIKSHNLGLPTLLIQPAPPAATG